MKEKFKTHSSFRAQNKEQLQKIVTAKVERIVNTKLKNAS